MSNLKRILAEKIAVSGGKITFSDYMQEVLYHPTWGYYNRPEMTIGERGDFYTSPMIHPIFGQCVARQVYELWTQMGSPGSFVIVEMGTGTGALARDLLTEWDRLQQLPEAGTSAFGELHAAGVRYIIIEQSPILHEKQKETTAKIARERIEWHSTLQEAPGYGSWAGVIISNELLDALPVHRLIFEEGRLQERYVTLSGMDETDEPRLAEITGPLSDHSLPTLLPKEMVSQLKEGDRIEVSPHWGDVITTMADGLAEGSVITIDYGNVAPDVYWKHVRTGGIRCYYRQMLVTDPYERIGQQDITADVDFSYLQRTGETVGLKTVWFSNQTEFLEKFGFLDQVQQLQRQAFKDLRADFELQKMLTLYLPQNGLGDACKVLIQSKGKTGSDE